MPEWTRVRDIQLGVDFLKVANTRRIAEKLMDTMQIKEVSSMVNAVITNGIRDYSVIPNDIEKLRGQAVELKKEMAKQNADSLSLDQVMMLLLVEAMIGPYLGDEPEMMDFFMNWIAEESRVLDVKEFNENPYIRNIDFKNRQQGDFELRYHDSMPYELDIYNVPKRLEQIPVDIPRISCFIEKFKFPVIFQKSIQSTWMSVSPNEVFTMEKPIKQAKGKVLTLGCGMGYFAYMVSLKAEVESVTIVELEQSVIDLFETFILPQFDNKDKITLIKADAIEYMRNLEDGQYDFCFADIWIGIDDIQPYFAVKEIGKKFRKTAIEYWIEESFAILLSGYVWIEIMKGFSEANHIDIPSADDIQFTEDDTRIEKYIHKLLENVEITKPEHIDYYMNPKNIIDLVNRTDMVF